MGLMARKPAAALAQDTLRIVAHGTYEAGGHVHSIAGPLASAIEDTIEYPPHTRIAIPPSAGRMTRIEVVNEASLSAAERLVREGHAPCVLNFASARNPGGGFLNGARAQEESLARSSGLYPCLLSREMYDHHRSSHDPLYSHWVIHSPGVPVFRSDKGALLDPFYLCSFLTSPACNAGVALERAGRGRAISVRESIRRTMGERVEKVLAVAAERGEEALVLGAWGCGVFRNDPGEVAALFRQALEGPFRGHFSRVIFAILDWSAERRFIGPFEEHFGAAS